MTRYHEVVVIKRHRHSETYTVLGLIKASLFSIVMTVAQFVYRLQYAEHEAKMCDTKRGKKDVKKVLFLYRG